MSSYYFLQTCLFSRLPPPIRILQTLLPLQPSGTSLKFFQVPQPIYGESNSIIVLHIFFIFLHISFIFLHISFVFLYMSSYFLHISSYFLHFPGTWKNSEFLPRPWDLENSEALGLGKNLSYLIYEHETCFLVPGFGTL